MPCIYARWIYATCHTHAKETVQKSRLLFILNKKQPTGEGFVCVSVCVRWWEMSNLIILSFFFFTCVSTNAICCEGEYCIFLCASLRRFFISLRMKWLTLVWLDHLSVYFFSAPRFLFRSTKACFFVSLVFFCVLSCNWLFSSRSYFHLYFPKLHALCRLVGM